MIEFLPTLNALLNTTSAVLLVSGRHFIKKGRRDVHRKFMFGTIAASILFLISYLTYHSIHGTTRFLGEGLSRPLYFVVLTTHTIAAIVIVPLVIITLRYALKGNFAKHPKIAKWTYPIWLYVSITGVLVYTILYHLFPHS